MRRAAIAFLALVLFVGQASTQEGAQLPPLPGPGLDLPFDVDGDGRTSYEEQFIVNWCLEQGGPIAERVAEGIAQNFTETSIDLTSLFKALEAEGVAPGTAASSSYSDPRIVPNAALGGFPFCDCGTPPIPTGEAWDCADPNIFCVAFGNEFWTITEALTASQGVQGQVQIVVDPAHYSSLDEPSLPIHITASHPQELILRSKSNDFDPLNPTQHMVAIGLNPAQGQGQPAFHITNRSPIIQDFYLYGNPEGFGRLVYIYGDAAPTLCNNVFDGASYHECGAAVYAEFGSGPVAITCNKFVGNTSFAASGGAVAAHSIDDLHVLHNLFDSNKAFGSGCAVFVDAFQEGKVATILYNRFHDHLGDHVDSDGLGVSLVDVSARVGSNLFVDNYRGLSTIPELFDVKVASIAGWPVTYEIVNNTIYELDDVGGIKKVGSPTVIVLNNILWTEQGPSIRNISCSYVFNSNQSNNICPGNNNFSDDPTDDFDDFVTYRLFEGSYERDRGAREVQIGSLTFKSADYDAEGQMRREAIGADVPVHPDVGYDEFKDGFIRGDCDDGNPPLNISDFIAISDYLFGDYVPSCLVACDVTDDGRITLADIIYLQRFLFIPGPPPPPPFPACGLDPSAEDLPCTDHEYCPFQ